MTIPGLFVAALLIAAPLTAAYLVLFAVPQVAHSRFRHELWTIRDAVVDDLLDGRLTMSPEVRELLLRLYLAIKHAPEHTVRSGALAKLTLRGTTFPNLRKTLSHAPLPEAERQRLLGHLTQLQQVTVHHMLWGSPSGWLLVGAVKLTPATWLAQGRRPRVEQAAERELSALPRLYPEANFMSSRELASCSG